MADKEPRSSAYGVKDPEALAHNLARVFEEAGKAAAAYLKPREEGKEPLELSEGIGEFVKTISKVAEYWLGEPERVIEAERQLWTGYLDLWSSSLKRMLGQPAAPAIEPDPGDRRGRWPGGCGNL